MYGGKGQFSAPWLQFGNQGFGQQGFGQGNGQRQPMSTHCFGKKAWPNALADQRSQTEKEGEAGEKVPMIEANCEVCLLARDSDYIGTMELMKKERACVIVVKANADYEKSSDWCDILASRIVLSQYDENKFRKLVKLLDAFCIQEKIVNCSIRQKLRRNRREKKARERARLEARMARKNDEDTGVRTLFHGDTDTDDGEVIMANTDVNKENTSPASTSAGSTRTQSSSGSKNNRDDVCQAIIGLKMLKGEIKGHVVSGHKYPVSKELVWVCRWENEADVVNHSSEEIESWLKAVNDVSLIELKMTMIRAPEMYTMHTPQPFKKRLQRLHSADA